MFIISFNYRNSDIELRGRLSNLNIEDFRDFKEVFILSTCNRFEVIFNKEYDIDEVFKVFSKVISKEELKKADLFYGDEALKHIFKVASSLDSMVVGETQITGQLKQAFLEAYERGFLGKDLTRVLHFSFKCAKRVRNMTDISSNSVSVASVAVKMAKMKLDSLSGYSAILVGAGEMARLIAKNLVKERVNIILVNRNIDNAIKLKEELEDEVNIEIHSFDKLPKLINQYRLLFSATSSKEYIIKNSFVKKRDFKRLWFDLAIPRDIENISCLDIDVIRVDDLKVIANENLKKREKEIQKANALLLGCVEEFKEYLKSVEIEPVIKFLNESAQNVIKESLDNAIKKHFIDENVKDEVEKIMQNAFKRFLHTPIKNLKLLSNSPQIDVIVSNINRVFKDKDGNLDLNKCEYHIEKGIK